MKGCFHDGVAKSRPFTSSVLALTCKIQKQFMQRKTPASESEQAELGQEHLELLQWAIPLLIEKANVLKFDRRDRVDLWFVLLYASILELANSVCRLVSIGEPAGSRSLVRMVMEAHVDLVNLSNDDEYANFLDVTSLLEWQKTFEQAQEGDPYFKALCDMPSFQEEVGLEAERLAALRKNGYRKLQTKERFELADMGDDYQGLYHWLCSDTHNSLRGLSMRHIEIVNGDDFRIQILNVHYKKGSEMRRIGPNSGRSSIGGKPHPLRRSSRCRAWVGFAGRGQHRRAPKSTCRQPASKA